MDKMQSIFYRIQIELGLQFQTAFHLGSGMEGETGSDNGILLDRHTRTPIIPGSSCKGILRSTIEGLVAALDLENLWACGLQNGLYHKTKNCIGGDIKGDTYQQANKEYQDSNGQNTSLIEKHRCSVCDLFGSPLSAGRIFIDDAELLQPDDFVLSRRDGVGLSRDSGIAMDGVKYDYDVANPGLFYKLVIEAENVTEQDLVLISLGILEWKHAGIRIGGKTTRGLGHAQIEDIKVLTVDMRDKEQRKSYILKGEMQEQDPLNFFQQWVNKCMDNN